MRRRLVGWVLPSVDSRSSKRRTEVPYVWASTCNRTSVAIPVRLARKWSRRSLMPSSHSAQRIVGVCGIVADAMIELMIARLRAEGIEHLFLDMRTFGKEWCISWSDRGEKTIQFQDRALPVSAFSGIYARFVGFEEFDGAEGLTKGERNTANAECQTILTMFLDALDTLVVSRAGDSISNDSKPYQLQVIRRSGLLSPRTLVTSDPEAARAFFEECDRRVVFKSASGVRSIVQRLDERKLRQLTRIRYGPALFQEYVAGVDIRVHTVGDRVFATEITSEATDYRYATRSGHTAKLRATEIPFHIEAACLKLARGFGLPLSGIDLRRTDDGRYYCFEVNPSPAFLYYEREGKQPISKAVVDLLVAGLPR